VVAREKFSIKFKKQFQLLMRSFWSQVPLFRITLAIIMGVGAELFADWSLDLSATLIYPVCILFVLSVIAVSALALLRSTEVVYRFRLLNGVSINLLLISLGYLMAWFNTERNYPTHFKNFLDPESTVVAKITRPPLEKEKTIRMVGEVTKVINGNRVISVKGHLLINIPRSYESESITYGDLLIFKSTVMDLDDPKNPEEFNYRRYQYFHNVCQRVYLKKGEWKIGAHNQGNSLMANVYRLRAYFLSIITRYVPKKNDFAVASAIMLGYNDYLSGEISRAYATSGTLHVLSVSGLHVGIMFIMLNFLLKAFDKLGRKFQIGKAIFIILFIWFYACLTGLSPSVLR
jgi:competence protein ComEC